MMWLVVVVRLHHIFQGILMPGAQPLDHLKAEFTQEALGNLQGEQNAKLIENKLGKLWQKFDKVS